MGRQTLFTLVGSKTGCSKKCIKTQVNTNSQILLVVDGILFTAGINDMHFQIAHR